MQTHRNPCTMYKPDDLARARENINRHAWARDLYGQIKSQAGYYMTMDRGRMRSFISDQTPLVTVVCPDCGCGPWYAYILINQGDTLQCTDCKAMWDWDPEDTSETWNIQAVVRTYRLKYILGGLESAGIVYGIEGDVRYAEKAAILVERFAEVFKSYRLNQVNKNVWHDQNDPYYGKIDGWKQRDAWCARTVLIAYDLIRDSDVFEDEQRRSIDAFVEYVRDYFVESFNNPGTSTLEGYQYTDDLSPYLSHYSIQDHGGAWWCIAASAALTGDREILRSVVRLYEDMLKPEAGVFFQDGAFYECTADYTLGLLQTTIGIPEIIRGNLDTDMYANPSCALLEKCYTWFLDAAFPNDTNPAINDSHVGSPLRPFCSEIAYIVYNSQKALRHLKTLWGGDLNGGTEYSLFYRDPDAAVEGDGEPYAAASAHLPDIGLMILRHGEDKPSRTMAFIDYGPYIPAAHKQKDYLNFVLWSCGQEMVTEMGYNWNPEWARLWERGPLSHNTVLECAGQGEGGKPLLWCVTPGPKLAEAGLPPGNARLIALLPRSSGEPLIADVFSVSGDYDSYTWMLHAKSGDLEVAGLDALVPSGVPEPLRSGRSASAIDDVTATWTMDRGGLRTIIPNICDTTVTVSECPPEEDVIEDLHAEGGTLKPGAVLPYRGHLQVSRPGPDAVFAAVHAPFTHHPPAIEIECRTPSDAALALRIHTENERFLMLYNPSRVEAHFDGLSLKGRAAVVTVQDDALRSLCLASGTSLDFGETGLHLKETGNAYGVRSGDAFKRVEL
ncbi:MAG: heparinase II/III family protein [Gemmatimonadota bacterium]|nr:heparinase II/III family protein [Gemmatimonadota bacterium]